MPPRNPPSWARRRRVREADFLSPGEYLTEVAFLSNTPPEYTVVRLGRCLISHRYQQSSLPIDTARMLNGPSNEIPSCELSAEETRRVTYVSPIGILTSNRAAVVTYRIGQLSVPWQPIRLPVIDSCLCRELRINLILGAPFVEWHQNRIALLNQRRLLLAAIPQYVQNLNDMAPNNGGGGQEHVDHDNANYWMQPQTQMPLVVADEEMAMEGVVGSQEVNDGGQAHR